MSDTEEDSSTSESSWPVNENWLIGVLKEHYRAETNINIVVNIQKTIFFLIKQLNFKFIFYILGLQR